MPHRWMVSLFASLISIGIVVPPLEAQRSNSPASRVASAVREGPMWAHLRFLSDDLLEGRGTGARGSELAAHYLAAQFMALGLEPGGDSGTYFHRVPIITLNPAASLEITAGGSTRSLRYREDFVAWAERPESLVATSAEIVFVGYGIEAPEERWDDFKGMDVRGKILMVLVNDPGLADPSVFRGATLTYYGRWTYKLEEAARRGAAGVLLVHNDSMATYGWNTVRNSWTGDQVRLERTPGALHFGGWLSESAAAELLRERGFDLRQLVASATRRDFRPVPTGIAARVTVRSTVRRMAAYNVVGRLPGADPVLRDEIVLLAAHYDHLGVGQPVNGDSIMNGAQDNAAGVAVMLSVADAFVRSGVRPRRSLLFVGFAAEEKGLLGSQAFAENPTVPLRRIAGVLNCDCGNLYGATRDIGALGTEQSTLGRVFERAARAEGLRVSVDSQALRQGSFFRSDHFPLARAGVPALSWQEGDDYVGQPAGWGQAQKDRYNRERYHQPEDEILPWFTADGALQQARVLGRVALEVGNASAQPSWYPNSEFQAAGARRLGR